MHSGVDDYSKQTVLLTLEKNNNVLIWFSYAACVFSFFFFDALPRVIPNKVAASAPTAAQVRNLSA